MVKINLLIVKNMKNFQDIKQLCKLKDDYVKDMIKKCLI